MMVSGIGTTSGFEERIRFSEIDIVDSSAIDTGVLHTIPEGNYINGWDVNVSAVRVVSVKRNIRQHKHAEFILRVKRKGELEHFIARRYGDFARLHKRIRTELPGRAIPSLPRKNKSNSTASGIFAAFGGGAGDSDDGASLSTVSTRLTQLSVNPDASGATLSPRGHQRNGSLRSLRSSTSKNGTSPRVSADGRLAVGNSPEPADGDASEESTLYQNIANIILDCGSGTRKAAHLVAVLYPLHASQLPDCQYGSYGAVPHV